ncbi:hypothetical protein [Telmatospirillum sp.]|uniref:hypothetical protein n=1 Tax=Telmatospirillum sp. TaxID=2079197 RepID=UPI00283BEA2B|nr:hypothetical protein [Telmatospirillum sp.]MDR3436459.1 hypothetical protein [Telmatospirillum sp.]
MSISAALKALFTKADADIVADEKVVANDVVIGVKDADKIFHAGEAIISNSAKRTIHDVINDIQRIGSEIDALVGKAASVATTLATQQTALAALQTEYAAASSDLTTKAAAQQTATAATVVATAAVAPVVPVAG